MPLVFQIRYRGVLVAIEQEKATISLDNGAKSHNLTLLEANFQGPVRSLGTEGRKGNPAEEIPPSEVSYG